MSEEWQETNFKTQIEDGILEIGDGYRAQNSELGGKGPIFLRAGHVTNTHIDFDGVERFHDHLSRKVHSKMSKVGDTIITTKGNSTGRTSFVTDTTPLFIYSPHLSYWRTRKPDRLHNGFLRFWSQSEEFGSQLSAMKSSTDMAPYLSLTDQRRLQISLPPIAEQKRIAHILGTLDDKIELNRRMNATLEAMARALLQSWFVDFDPVRRNAARLQNQPSPQPSPNGRGRSAAEGEGAAGFDSLFPDSFEDSELGEIPKGWIPTTLGDEADFSTGFAFKSKSFAADSDVRLARGDNVKEGFFHWDSKARYWPEITSDLERYRLQVGDVLMGMDGSKVGKNWVRVRRCDLPCLLVQRVACLREKNSIGQHYLWILISDPRFRNYVDAVKTGTSIPHISGGQIKAYDFVSPPTGDNRVFKCCEQLVGPLGEQIDANIEQSQTLSALRDSLLPRLLSGEIVAPSEEKF